MKHALPPLTNDLLDAFAASAFACVIWLMGVVCKLGAPQRSRRLNRFLASLERAVESILFLQAVRRFGPPPPRRRVPAGAPPGFRRRRGARLRLFFRNAGVRARKAHFAQRLGALVAALAEPERHIAYFTRRLLRGLRAARLIPVAPPAAACASRATSLVAYADTS